MVHYHLKVKGLSRTDSCIKNHAVFNLFFFSQKLLKVTIISFTHQKNIYIFIKSGVIVYNIM